MQVPSFNYLLNQLKCNNEDLKKSYGFYQGIPLDNFIDINKFIKVLYSLFKINDLLLNTQEGIDIDVDISTAKKGQRFLFTEEYPDQGDKNRDTITFEILKRGPASLSRDEKPFMGTKHYRPIYLGDYKDPIEGDHKIQMLKMTDNLVRFSCWSTKASQSHRLASFLENFFDKNYHFLRQFVPVFIFEGQFVDTRATDKYGRLRYFPIHLDYFIRTAEIYSISEKELKIIEININEITSIITNLEE